MANKRVKIDPRIPRYNDLLQVVFSGIKELGGSANNDEIVEQVIKDIELEEDLVNKIHKGTNQSEIAYQIAWAKTYLKKYGALVNSGRSVWSIAPAYFKVDKLDEREVLSKTSKAWRKNRKPSDSLPPEDGDASNDDAEFPDEIKPWREKLLDVLQNMDPYGFERLSKRLLRECGFTNVEVTKKSSDGGIDGTGKLRINGFFSFNVAFQCKRYKGSVGASEIRDFRGSLTTDIEKGVFITTGSFSKAAREEASNPGKQQIDLIDGEDFINKIAEYQIGVKPIIIYEIDEEFFNGI